MSEPTSRYLDHLPALYRQDPLLGKFLLAFEAILTGGDPAVLGFEALLDRLDRYVRPCPSDTDNQASAAPAEFLPWLASWLGFAFHHKWSVDQRRKLLQQARWLHEWRGTARGLQRFLELGLSTKGKDAPSVLITEPPETPGFFTVQVSSESAQRPDIERMTHISRWIIDREKPAHTWYRLYIIGPAMRIKNEPQDPKEGIRVNETMLGCVPRTQTRGTSDG